MAAKFVIAGKSDCPFYARAELLADELTLNLPNFNVHKIVLSPSEWKEWIKSTCSEKGWNYSGQSPIIWRELINRGGKGILVGSCNDFLEYAKGYYGISCKNSTPDLDLISAENKTTKEQDIEKMHQLKAAINPYKIAMTSADCDLAYHILPLMIREDVFGIKQEVSISLHYNRSDVEEDMSEKINGLMMELQDCAETNLREINATTVLQKSFENADFVVILNPSKEMNHDVVCQLEKIALKLKECLKDTAKVLLVGENAIISSNIIHYFLNGIHRQNLMAMTRFEENSGKAAIAKVLEVNSAGIKDLIIWGSNKEFLVDYNLAMAHGYNGAIWAPHIDDFSHSVNEMVYNKKFLDNELPEVLNNDEFCSTTHKLLFSAAFISQLKDLLSKADKKDEIYSLGVISDGSFGVPDGLIYSFPVKYTQEGFTIQTNLICDETWVESIKRTADELQDHCDELIALVDPTVLKKKEAKVKTESPNPTESITENGAENLVEENTAKDDMENSTEPTQE